MDGVGVGVSVSDASVLKINVFQYYVQSAPSLKFVDRSTPPPLHSCTHNLNWVVQKHACYHWFAARVKRLAKRLAICSKVRYEQQRQIF